jgi:glycosyltransferase involved in cell wall biosynthesis
MRVAVVLATYNNPRWLEKVLWGYASQRNSDFEVVIADDGSGPETAALIDRFRRETRLRITHVWHEDRGFRKTEILNKAIVASSADYMIFSDGDCIPRDDFIDVHVQYARPRQFLAGGYLKLPMRVSEAITPDDIRSGRFAELGWLRRKGYRPRHRALRLLRSKVVAVVGDLVTPTPPSWKGHNASTWREALIAVNGFDQDMGYGSEDRALGERLLNMGYKPKRIRFRTAVLHLDHGRPWRDEAVVLNNEHLIRTRIQRDGEVRARIGIAELEMAPGDTVTTASAQSTVPVK